MAAEGFASTKVPARSIESCRNNGRPSKYDPIFEEQVITIMGAGYSLTAVAGKLGVCRQTIHNWMARHPGFASAVNAGRASRVAFLEEMLLSGRNNTGAIFALKNACPEEWCDRRAADRPDEPAANSADKASDIELARALALILARAGASVGTDYGMAAGVLD